MNVIGHGIDLVELARIERMLAEHGSRFLERCFTAEERAYSEAGAALRVERFAARFAAKEAVLKALGTGWRNGISWTDIEVTREPSGQPGIRLSGRCAEIACSMGIGAWRLSMTHTKSHASASALALAAPGG